MAKTKEPCLKNFIEGDIQGLNCMTPQRRMEIIWRKRLMTVMISVWKYHNLPPNLPASEIEKRLIYQGWTAVYNHPVYGLVTCDGARYDIGIYNDAKKVTLIQPALGQFVGTNGIDCVIGWNTSLDKDMNSGTAMGRLLDHYAHVLATLDVSMDNIATNARGMNTLYAKSENAQNSIELWYKSLREGNVKTITLDDEMFEQAAPMLGSDFLEVKNMLMDIDRIKTSYLKEFYNKCGIQYIEQKAERLITDEVMGDKDALSIELWDQLMCRCEFMDKINALFGTSIKVEVNNSVIT